MKKLKEHESTYVHIPKHIVVALLVLTGSGMLGTLVGLYWFQLFGPLVGCIAAAFCGASIMTCWSRIFE